MRATIASVPPLAYPLACPPHLSPPPSFHLRAYAGKLYKSLSAAAMAAAKDLGLTNKTQNGFTFWGLSKPPRPPTDALVALERAWERYHGNVVALVKEGVTDENRSKVVAAISNHAQMIESLREKVA